MIRIPRTLTQRDPRNSRHIKEAMDIIHTLGIEVLKASSVELNAYGIDTSSYRIRKSVKNSVGVGRFFELREGLMFCDNIVSKCQKCKHPIQYRPHFAVVPTILCCFCALDHLLPEYWDEKDKRLSGKRKKVQRPK